LTVELYFFASGHSLPVDGRRAWRWMGEAMKFLLGVLGLLLIIEGLPYFAFPGQMKRWLAKVQNVTDMQLRTAGLLAMAVGLLLAYLSKG
jgi:hypothetical protein